MLRGMLSYLLQAKLGEAVSAQAKLGIGPVPLADANEMLLRLSQLPHDRLRGLIVIAALDDENPTSSQGLNIQTFALGTPTTLEPLLELGSHVLDEKLANPERLMEGEICRDCGCEHTHFDNVENFGSDPQHVGGITELDRLLNTLMGMRRTF